MLKTSWIGLIDIWIPIENCTHALLGLKLVLVLEKQTKNNNKKPYIKDKENPQFSLQKRPTYKKLYYKSPNESLGTTNFYSFCVISAHCLLLWIVSIQCLFSLPSNTFSLFSGFVSLIV